MNRKPPIRFVCPACGQPMNKLLDSRGRPNLGGVYRRRMCEACGTRISTLESLVPESIEMTEDIAAERALAALNRLGKSA